MTFKKADFKTSDGSCVTPSTMTLVNPHQGTVTFSPANKSWLTFGRQGKK